MAKVPGRDDKFACPCCGKNWTDPRVENLVRQLEEEVGEKLTVNSGYRCKNHNKEIGDSPTSSHMKGLAVDLACETSRLRHRLIGAAIRLGVNRIGIGKNYMHLDIDRQKSPRVIWVY